MIVLKPIGGLCNRLRVIFSYKERFKEPMLIWWKEDKYCNGFFLDYFKKPEGLEFVKKYTGIVSYTTCYAYPGVQPNYNYLELTDIMKTELSNRLDRLGCEYTSVHIRGTDHIALAKAKQKHTSDEEFMDFLDKDNNKVFLATDDPMIQDKFLKIYGDRITIFNKIGSGDTLRLTTLKEAVLDLFVCVHSKKVYGFAIFIVY